jgi:hypothetical protein
MKLMSIDDPQTRRAQAAMVQLLVLTQAQVLPDLSIKPLNAATLADELLRGAENLVQWFHTHGNKLSRVFYVVTLSSKYTRALTLENILGH